MVIVLCSSPRVPLKMPSLSKDGHYRMLRLASKTSGQWRDMGRVTGFHVGQQVPSFDEYFTLLSESSTSAPKLCERVSTNRPPNERDSFA